MDDLVAELSQSYLFSELPARHLKKIAAAMQVRKVSEGEVLIREGTHSREFFVILEGTVDITVRNHRRASGARGDFFGELAIIGKSARTATVTVTTPSRIAAMDAKDFEHLIESEPKIALHMVHVLARRLEELTVKRLGDFT